MDVGSATRSISGISFASQEDWIIGQTTDANAASLGVGDTGNVTASGKATYIGQNAGVDTNSLFLSGSLVTTDVYIGSIAGNTDNILQIKSGTVFDAISFRLADENFLSLAGDYSDFGTLLTAHVGHRLLRRRQANA